MLFRLFPWSPRGDTIQALYGAIVAQARAPVFYRDYGVPDTVAGRTDMVMLHVILFFRRVRQESEPVRALGQAIFDHFCKDMDHSLRELGVGDLAVPRRMRGIGEAFYGQAAAYDAALAAADPEELAAALNRNVFSTADPAAARSEALADYVRAAVRALKSQSCEELAAGRLHFPPPAPISEPP